MEPGWSSREQADVFDVTSSLGKAIDSAGYKTDLVPVTTDNLDLFLSAYNPQNSIVFNWCENLPGIHNSEWMVAKYLEEHDFIFTGSSSATIAQAQDKSLIKKLLDLNSILTPAWAVYDNVKNIRWKRFPSIVKPSREHCSEGIGRDSVVTTPADLKERIAFIIEKYGEPAIVEDFIDGRELHVSLWGNETIGVLPRWKWIFPHSTNSRTGCVPMRRSLCPIHATIRILRRCCRRRSLRMSFATWSTHAKRPMP
jgi:D-alanine-D-alanine ligase